MEHFLKWVNKKTGLKPYETPRLEVLIEYEHTNQQYIVVETRRCKLTGEILGTRNVLYIAEGHVAYSLPTRIDENKNMFDYLAFIMTKDEFETMCDALHAKPTNPEGYSGVLQSLLQEGFHG